MLEDGNKLVRAQNVVGILIALQIANIDDAALVIEPPGPAHHDNALTADQYTELMEVLGRDSEAAVVMSVPVDSEDRFGMPESALRAARESHGLNNPTIRSGMYVPTRREVAEKPPEWLRQVLIDWMWESPSELIPSDMQIAEVRAVLLARSDAADRAVAQIIVECDEYLNSGS